MFSNGFMRKVCLLTLVIIVSITGLAYGFPEQRENRIERWRLDIQYLSDALQQRHPNLFFKISKRDFDKAIINLKQSVSNLSDSEIKVEIARIVAMCDDPHTKVSLLQEGMKFQRLPITLYWYSDGIYVIAAAEEYAGLNGKKVIKIGGTPVDEAISKIASLVPHENSMWKQYAVPVYLSIPEVLSALKISATDKQIKFECEGPNGMIFTQDVKAVSPRTTLKYNWYSFDDTKGWPLYLQNTGVSYLFNYFEEAKTLYVQYNKCTELNNKPLPEFLQELTTFIKTQPVDKLVIDFRNNYTGDDKLITQFINEIKNYAELNKKGHLFAIIGRRTFSAGATSIVQLRNETNTIVVGEPAGDFLEHFDEIREFVLPNCGLEVTYPSTYVQLPGKGSKPGKPGTLIAPDVAVSFSADDYFNKKDIALDAIFNYTK